MKIILNHAFRTTFLTRNYLKFTFSSTNSDKISQLNLRFEQLKQSINQSKTPQDKIPLKLEMIKVQQNIHQEKGIEKKYYEGYFWDQFTLCKIHAQLGQFDQSQQILESILKDNYQEEYASNRLDQLLFFQSLNAVAARLYLDKGEEISKILDFALKAYSYNEILYKEYCPNFQDQEKQSKPEIQFVLQFHIMASQTSDLLLLSELYHKLGDNEQSLSYLQEKAHIQEKIIVVIQKVLRKEIKPQIQIEKEEDLKMTMMTFLVEQCKTFTLIVERFLDLNDQQETENFLSIAQKYFEYLISQKIIPAHHYTNLTFTLIKAKLSFKFNKTNFQNLLKELSSLMKIAEEKYSSKEICLERFNYYYFLHQMHNDQIQKLDQILEELKTNYPIEAIEKSIILNNVKLSMLEKQVNLSLIILQSEQILGSLDLSLEINQLIIDFQKYQQIFKNKYIIKVSQNRIINTLCKVQRKLGIDSLTRKNEHLRAINHRFLPCSWKAFIRRSLPWQRIKCGGKCSQFNKYLRQIASGFKDIDKVIELLSSKDQAISENFIPMSLKIYYLELFKKNDQLKSEYQQLKLVISNSHLENKDEYLKNINEKLDKLQSL